MNSDYINPFITGTVETVKQVTGIKLGIEGTSLNQSPVKSCGTLVQVGIVGDIRGSMLTNIKDEYKDVILDKMFGGMNYEDQSQEMLNSAIGELFNMVMGSVATKLESIGVSIDITPPNIVNGRGSSVSVSNSPVIKLLLGGEGLALELFLSIK